MYVISISPTGALVVQHGEFFYASGCVGKRNFCVVSVESDVVVHCETPKLRIILY
jgi:hypothetical protein